MQSVTTIGRLQPKIAVAKTNRLGFRSSGAGWTRHSKRRRSARLIGFPMFSAAQAGRGVGRRRITCGPDPGIWRLCRLKARLGQARVRGGA
jgi:hypothetical protein